MCNVCMAKDLLNEALTKQGVLLSQYEEAFVASKLFLEEVLKHCWCAKSPEITFVPRTNSILFVWDKIVDGMKKSETFVDIFCDGTVEVLHSDYTKSKTGFFLTFNIDNSKMRTLAVDICRNI